MMCQSSVFPLCYFWLEGHWNVIVIKTWNTSQLKKCGLPQPFPWGFYGQWMPPLVCKVQGGSNMTGTDLCVNKPHCTAAVRPWESEADGTFSPTRNLITMRCSTLRGTFCSLITLATPRQDWTGSIPSRREGGGCGFTLSRSHSCCAVRLLYIQISPGHIWTTFYLFQWNTTISYYLTY